MTEDPASYGHAPSSDFESQFRRVFEAAECKTQLKLAEFFGIKQSSISDAKRRQSIPAEWRVKLFEKKSINPEWVLHGGNVKYLAPADSARNTPHVVQVTEVRPPEECSFQELFSELVRRVLEKPDGEQIQKAVAETWCSNRKPDGEA